MTAPTTTAPTMTAAVCTRNRAELTRHAVESLLAQDVESDRLDIVVVDNGSTDATVDVVTELARRDRRVRLVAEPTPGLSRARNRAIEVSAGEVIAFLDDDAVAVPNWARDHLGAFAADSDIVATGGRIDLVWPDTRPAWLPFELDGMYSGLDLPVGTTDFPPGEFPYGANMAFRRAVFADVGGFATELGRQGGSLLSGEERELAARLRAVGGRLVYVASAAVDHHVLPDRTSRRWLLRRCFDQGRSIVVINQLDRPRSRAYWTARGGKQALRAAASGAGLVARSAMRRQVDDRGMLFGARAAQAAGTAMSSIRLGLAR